MPKSSLQLSEPLLSTLFGLVRDVGVLQSSLEATSDVVGVLVLVAGRFGGNLAAVLEVLENLLGVLLGLIRGV